MAAEAGRDLGDELVGPGFMMEFLQSHTNVVMQPPVGHPYYRGINPYALGFAMYTDIKRICEEPTDEDRAWFPAIAGSDWLETLDHAMRNFKDESFIAQYLSPKVMRLGQSYMHSAKLPRAIQPQLQRIAMAMQAAAR